MSIEVPKIEVRYEHLSVEGDVYVGSRALPTLLNVTLNTIEVYKDVPFFFNVKQRDNFPLSNWEWLNFVIWNNCCYVFFSGSSGRVFVSMESSTGIFYLNFC